MNEMYMTRVVGLHDHEHGDWLKYAQNLELETPYQVYSFTDLREIDNPHNEQLRNAAFWSNVLCVQKELIFPKPTKAAMGAINSSLISSVGPTDLYIFNKDYRFKKDTFEDILYFLRLESDVTEILSVIKDNNHDKLTDEEGDK